MADSPGSRRRPTAPVGSVERSGTRLFITPPVFCCAGRQAVIEHGGGRKQKQARWCGAHQRNGLCDHTRNTVLDGPRFRGCIGYLQKIHPDLEAGFAAHGDLPVIALLVPGDIPAHHPVDGIGDDAPTVAYSVQLPIGRSDRPPTDPAGARRDVTGRQGQLVVGIDAVQFKSHPVGQAAHALPVHVAEHPGQRPVLQVQGVGPAG